jgi:hypothetical protein
MGDLYDLPSTDNARPMHRTNGHIGHNKHYINWTHDDHYHKTNSAKSKEKSAKSPPSNNLRYSKYSVEQ